MLELLMMQANPGNQGVVIPVWGWVVILSVLGASFSVIAWLLKRRVAENYRALEDLNSKVEIRTAQLPELWEKVKNIKILQKEREQTLPSAAEQALRELRDARIQFALKIEQIQSEIKAVERKQALTNTDLRKDIDELKEKLWNQVSACKESYVWRNDYRAKVMEIMEVLDKLKTTAVKLEQRTNDWGKKS